MTAAELIAELNRIADEMMERGDPSGRFDPPYTTVHVGTIAGGNARNILAKSCSFHWEFRGLPSLDPQEIPARLERFAQEVALEAAQPLRRVRPDRDHARMSRCRASRRIPARAAEALALRLAGKNQTHDGALRHRGGALPGGRHSDRRLRPGLDRPGAPAGRIHHARRSSRPAQSAFMRRLAATCAAVWSCRSEQSCSDRLKRARMICTASSSALVDRSPLRPRPGRDRRSGSRTRR